MSDAMSRAREIAAKLRGGFSDTGPPPEKRSEGGFSDGPPAGKPHLADIAAAAAAAVRNGCPAGRPSQNSRKVVITTGRADLLTSRNRP